MTLGLLSHVATLTQRAVDSLLHPSLVANVDMRTKARILVALTLFFSLVAWMVGRISGAGEGNQLAVIIGVWMSILFLGNLVILRLLGWFRFTTLLFLGEYFLYGVVVSLANIHTLPILSPVLMVLPIVAGILLDARFGLAAIAFVAGVAGLLAFLEGRLPDPVFADAPPALGLMFGSAGGLVFGVVVFNTIMIWGITVTRRLAEERDRLLAFRSEFISAVNHELRTPITAVAGAISLIEAGTAGPLDAQTKKLIGIAKRNSDLLSTLINDILDIERMEEGTYEVSVEDLDLVEVVRDSIALNEVYARRFSVTFDLVGTTARASVKANRNRLLQVLANLLSNAAKFSPADSQVEVSVAPRDGLYRVAVTDRGPGIPEDFQDRIFERFSQSSDTETEDQTGSGLGLSIAKSIVELHGGTIGFESVPEGGTTFHFDLPAVEPRAILPD